METPPKGYEIRRIFDKEDSPSFCAFIAQSKRSFFKWHYHKYYEIFAPFSGTGEWRILDQHGDFNAGDIFLAGPELLHSFNALKDWREKEKEFCFEAHVVMFDFSVKRIPEFSELDSFLERASMGLFFPHAKTSSLMKKFQVMHDKTPLRQALILLDILIELSSMEYSIISENPMRLLSPEKSERMGTILDFISTNWRTDFPLEQLAVHVGMSVSGLCSFVKATLRKTVHEQVHEIRINNACRMLRSADKQISEIAYLCGYNTLSSFNRKFKKLMNLSPREFKNSI